MPVEYGNKLAGQPLKRRVREHTQKLWDIVILTCIAASLILGCLVALMILSVSGSALRITQRYFWVLLVVEIICGAVMLRAQKHLDRGMDKIYRSRIKWLRGGQAEGLVAWHFRSLSNSWHVFHNVVCYGTGDIDHVLIGPAGVFAISTKSHRGLYTADGDRHFRNNKPTDDVEQAIRLAMQLKDRLREIVEGDLPWVQAVLALPLAYVDLPAKRQNIWVLREDDLVSAFEDAPVRIRPNDIARFAKAIETIRAQSPAGVI